MTNIAIAPVDATKAKKRPVRELMKDINIGSKTQQNGMA
jgi:hypothetical protein